MFALGCASVDRFVSVNCKLAVVQFADVSGTGIEMQLMGR